MRNANWLAWVASAAAVLLAVALAVWKSQSKDDWLSENGASLLAAMGGVAAFFFVARASALQRRQMQSAELLTAFELARPDLEGLSRRIAANARIVVQKRKDGRPGKLAARSAEFDAGDRTVFARMFGTGVRIKKRLPLATSHNLRIQTRLYADIFENVLQLSPTKELTRFLKIGPLGRAYCAIKVALDEDKKGEFAELLMSVDASYADAADPLTDTEGN